MSTAAPLQNTTTKSPLMSNLSLAGLLLQRKCACGNSTMVGGECGECSKNKLQRKLSVGASNDPLEQEADRVADQVLAAPGYSTVSGVSPRIQHFTGQATGDAVTAPASVDRVLSGSGRSLDPAIQQDMGQSFGYDFSQVRVHTGSAAEQSAQDVNAHAYTVGHIIVFGTSRFEPRSHEGSRLIAHELTHVVQQAPAVGSSGPGPTILQRQPAFPSAGPGVVEESAKKTEPITRAEQAKHQYGLECLGDSVMYMIQSYGFMPPDMTRQEFEHAFTQLNPAGFSKSNKIRVGGKEQPGAMPVDLFTRALEGSDNPPKVRTSIGPIPMTRTEATLRGADSGGLSAQDVYKKLPAIFSAFKAQSEKPGYEFMKAYRPSTEAFKSAGKDEWTATDELETNAIGDEYFQKGNTLLIEMSLVYPATSGVEHRCVVVGKSKFTIKDSAGKNHYLYPADDPWYGSTLVMVPPDTDGWVEKDLKAGVRVDDRVNGLLKYNGQTVIQIAKGGSHVYRRKKMNP